ncbi:unnamed protein product [marine sediment metagenome]|uniref:DUF3795 domain-containing protein n=1 Tax=marine sediment metagenome TaxID=412755 RepID=X0XYU8_9ZZZZ
MPNATAFEIVKDQIGCCGIWCGSCVVGNGALREVTKGYAAMIEAHGLKEWGPRDVDYEELAKGLESIQATPLCPGCLNGGGRDNCEMKACASGKGIDDCSECGEPAGCPHIDVLQKMRSGAVAAGLLVKNESVDKQELIEQWTAQLKSKWPCSVLFAGD